MKIRLAITKHSVITMVKSAAEANLFIMSKRIFGSLLLCSLFGFAQKPAESPKPESPEAKKTEAAVASPAAMGGGAAVDPNAYKIGVEDILGIQVWREPDISRAYTVRADGKINMPLVGEIQAADLSPKAFEAKVVEALGAIMNRPQVNVFVLEVRSRKYYVSGEVGKTGAFFIPSKMTVLEALSLAGGLKEFANKKKIFIKRGNEQIKYDYNSVVKGKKPDIEIQPNDHIFVP